MNYFKSLWLPILAAVVGTLFSATVANAQETFTVAGGGGAKNGSTYSHMLTTIIAQCSTPELQIQEVNTSGGIQNLDLIKSLKVKSAFVPTDLLISAKMDNPTSVSMIKTLYALHPEEFHLIARGDTKTEGGVTIGGFNIGGKDVAFRNPDDLKGRSVGAVGGSVRSAQIFSEFLKLNLKVEQFPSNAELTKALLDGKVDAILVVAGAPSDLVRSLDSRFRLLPVRANADLSAVYTTTKIQYEKLNGGKSVDTIATQALWVTRTFRSQEALTSLGKLRACVTSNLAKIQDADGSHPKWLSVNPDDHGKWDWYDLPSAAVSAPAVKTKK